MTPDNEKCLIDPFSGTVIQKLEGDLHNPDKSIRVSAMSAFVSSGDQAIPYLLTILDDNDWKVRYRAAEALGLIGSSAAVQGLIHLTGDTKDHVRYMASKSLGLIGDKSGFDALITLLDDEHVYTRRITAESLSKIGDPAAIPILEKTVRLEKNSEIREHMRDALESLKKKIT